MKLILLGLLLLFPLCLHATDEPERSGEGLSIKNIKCRDDIFSKMEKYNVQYADDEKIFDFKNENFKVKGKVYVFGDLVAEPGTTGTNYIFERAEKGKCSYKIFTYTIGIKGNPLNSKSTSGGGGTKLVKDVVALKALFAPHQNWVNDKFFPSLLKNKKALVEFVNSN